MQNRTNAESTHGKVGFMCLRDNVSLFFVSEEYSESTKTAAETMDIGTHNR